MDIGDGVSGEATGGDIGGGSSRLSHSRVRRGGFGGAGGSESSLTKSSKEFGLTLRG